MMQQQGLPTLEQIKTVLLNTFSNNRAQQLEAENFLSQLRHVNGFCSSILQLVLQSQQENSQQALYIQQAGVIFLKNFITKNYDERGNFFGEEDSEPTEKLIPISAEDRQFLRENILKALVMSSTVIQSQLCVVLHTMICTDYPVNWVNLVDEIVNLLKSNDVRCVYAALLALDSLLKRYKTALEDHYRIVVNDIVSRTFDIVTGLFQYLLSQNTDEFAVMRKLIVKVIWSAFQNGVPQYYTLEVKEGKLDRFTKLMEMLLESYKIQVPPLNIDSVENPHWKVKKWIGHFGYRLLLTFSALEVRPNTSAEEAKIAEYFISQHAQKFLQIFLQLVQYNIKGSYVPYRIITLVFRYLDGCISNPDLYKSTIISNLKALIVETIFPYLYFSSGDKELWEFDPQEWIRIGYDLSEDLWNTRINAMGTLTTLLTTRRKDSFGIYLQYITEVLTNYANGTHVNPSLKDAVLYTIGNMSKLFSKSAMTKDKIEDLLLMFVFPEFTNTQQPYLRARACWALGRFSEISYKNPSTMNDGMKHVLNCLQDKQIPVRIQAGLTLSCLLNLENSIQQIRPILPQLLDVYMSIMNEMEHSTVVRSIELLVGAFAEEMEPFAVSICSRMSATYIRLLDEDDNDLDNAESDILMENCIQTILTLMQSFTSKPGVYRQLEPVILPLILKILENQEYGYDFVENAMDMLTYLTYYCENGMVSENCWSILPAIYEAFNGWAYDFIGYLVASLDNFISKNPQRFLQNPDHVTMVYHLCAKHLGKDAETVEKEAQGACKILSSMMQNCKGAIDSEIPKYLEMVMCQIDLAESPAFTVLLLEVVADAIIYNMELALSFIESKQFTVKLFSKWFQTLPKFMRVYDKKIAVIAFSNIIGYPNFSSLPQALQANVEYLVNASIRLLKEISELKKKLAEEKDKEEDDGDFEDDYDSEEEEYNNGGSTTDKQMTLTVDSLKHNPHLQKLVETLTSSSYDVQADEEIDEMEIFDSLLDKFDENVYFGKAMVSFSSSPSFQAIVAKLSNEDSNSLQQLMQASMQQ
ncbi:importin-7 [Naegleria gruberi]|uniref:Importin-7 n=1 Tax=Naegleria gruberi TaxID=5762 RepID=D2VQW7_NAEGR|nr:importin-7 [Naegleria gruberi]EFC40708.1 importin-7 [Naegleria gruberi]|eukprot:XP_002673452.1 importin-7 [Naegleria gruberi]